MPDIFCNHKLLFVAAILVLPTSHLPRDGGYAAAQADDAPRVRRVAIDDSENCGYVRGLVDLGESLRIYYEIRNETFELHYAEARKKDLTAWKHKGRIVVPDDYPRRKPDEGEALQIKLIDGKWHGWTATRGGLGLFTSDDGIRWKYVAQAHNGESDDLTDIIYHDGLYWLYGRARDFDGLDRRGVHIYSEDAWEADFDDKGVTIDPADVFDYSGDSVPDLYNVHVFPQDDGSVDVMASVYWRERDRRPVHPTKDRLTGEIFSVWMEADDLRLTNLRLKSKQSIVPYEWHTRVSENPFATSSEKEVGQVYATARQTFDDVEVIAYLAADATHYEGWNPKLDTWPGYDKKRSVNVAIRHGRED